MNLIEMKRRHFLQTSGLALGSVPIGKSILAADSEKRTDILSYPEKVTAWFAGNEVTLLKNGAWKWGTDNKNRILGLIGLKLKLCCKLFLIYF
jgi:hypothetical protein